LRGDANAVGERMCDYDLLGKSESREGWNTNEDIYIWQG